MTTLREWIKEMLQAFLPKPQSNAWDDYKKARAMEFAAVASRQDAEPVSRR